MTECNTQAMLFSNVNRKQVVTDFNGGTITSDTGILYLREADKKLGVSEIVNRCIKDIRDLRYCTHEQKKLIQQRIYGIAGEYEDINDHNELRKDPAFQTAVEKEINEDDFLGSASTLCRLENHVTQDDIRRLAKSSIEMFMDSFEKAPKRLTFDFDPTDDEIHGGQEKRFFHGYYNHYCYLPLYVFCGSRLVLAYLRPSNIDGSKYCRAILKMIVKMVRQRWPGVRITVRGDSGFARPRLMRWCERHGLTLYSGSPRTMY